MKRIWVLILFLVLLQDSKGHPQSVNQSEELISRDNRIKQLEEREIELERELEKKKNQIHILEERDIMHLREEDSKNKLILHLQEMEIRLLEKLELKSDQVEKLQVENASYRAKDDSMTTVLNELRQCQRENKETEQLKSQITSKGNNLGKVEAELSSHNNMTDAKDKKMNELELKVKVEDRERLRFNQISLVEDKTAKSCIGRGSTGLQIVTLSKGLTFEVLCNSFIAGPGWTVIQQRIDGKVEFFRDWNSYRDGFGDFWNGEFFLGLEKIHQLTAEQPHELYIHMKRFNGSTFHARYEEFAIAGEDDQYKLIKLGELVSGTEENDLWWHKNMKFSTYDRDNDREDSSNCADFYHGGWWYRGCAMCNLNGKYFSSETNSAQSIYWEGVTSLKQVKMMIRPKVTSK